jgi:uncharacterized protein
MKKILLDTNFLLIPYQFGVDIFTQIDKVSTFKYGLFVLDKGFEELKTIMQQQRGKSRDAAKIALKLIAIKNIEIIKTESRKKTDDIIIDIAPKEGFIVATQDKELRGRLKKEKVPLMVLRQKKKVMLFDWKEMQVD